MAGMTSRPGIAEKGTKSTTRRSTVCGYIKTAQLIEEDDDKNNEDDDNKFLHQLTHRTGKFWDEVAGAPPITEST